MPSSPEMSTCCYRVPLKPQGAATTTSPTWPLLPRPRGRRHLKVLYPPLVRRPLPREGPSPTRRWLLILTALLFLQIYSEEVLDPLEDQLRNLEEEWKPTAGQRGFAEEVVSGSWVYSEQGPEEPCPQQICPELGQKLHEGKLMNSQTGPEFDRAQQTYPDEGPEVYSGRVLASLYVMKVHCQSMAIKKPLLQKLTQLPLQEKWTLGRQWRTLDKNHSDCLAMK